MYRPDEHPLDAEEVSTTYEVPADYMVGSSHESTPATPLTGRGHPMEEVHYQAHPITARVIPSINNLEEDERIGVHSVWGSAPPS